MPIEDVDKFSDAAEAKIKVLNEHFRKFFLRAIMAGVFVGSAMIFSNSVVNTFLKTDLAIGKFFGAVVFSMAVLLIVFVGGELFTGNNFTMAFAAFDKRVSWKDVGRVWLVSYIGNFIGCIFVAFLFVLAGASGTKEYYGTIMDGKIAISVSQTFFRAVLCNFFVCLAVVCSTRCKTDTLKFLMIVMCISCFVISGFEHCIANMATFATSVFLGYHYSILHLIGCLFLDTIGNVIGGALLLAWPLRRMSLDKPSAPIGERK